MSDLRERLERLADSLDPIEAATIREVLDLLFPTPRGSTAVDQLAAELARDPEKLQAALDQARKTEKAPS